MAANGSELALCTDSHSLLSNCWLSRLVTIRLHWSLMALSPQAVARR